MKKDRKIAGGKVYYRIVDIAEKYGIGQEPMAGLLENCGIKPVLEGIYDRDSFKGRVKRLEKSVTEWKNEQRRTNVKSEHTDGYMCISEISELFGVDVSCTRRKINRLGLPYVIGLRGEKRYHETVIQRYSMLLRKNRKLPVKNDPVLRDKGYITYSEFEVLAGITRPTLRNRIYSGMYSDCIMSGNVCYIHRRNLNVEPSRNRTALSRCPDDHIPIIKIREILGIRKLCIKRYIDMGVVNPMYVKKISCYSYIERREAEKFIEWYRKNRPGR